MGTSVGDNAATAGRAARLRASMLVIGDEILGGFVRDTNSGAVAARLHAEGVPLDRVVTVPDAHDAIAEALSAELSRVRPRLVLTSGGIGSTPDDLTMEAVAAHLGLDLVVDPEIDRRIGRVLDWTAERGALVTAAHENALRKMALVPRGAYLLEGARTIAPGVAVDVDGGVAEPGGATVVTLPGVPDELERILDEGIAPRFLAGRGEPQHVAELTHPYPESALSAVFEQLVAAFPDVQLGSYPGERSIVRLRGARERVEAAMALVRDGLARLDEEPGSAVLRATWAARSRRSQTS